LPNGILYGLGGYLAGKIPALDEAELDGGVTRVDQMLLSLGITSVQDASFINGPDQWNRFERWKAQGILHPRVTMMTGLEAFLGSKRKACLSDIAEDELRLGAVKIIADEVTGSLHPSQKELNEVVASIHAAGCQAAIHAIEQTVIEAAGNAIEFAIAKNPDSDHRHRIEHCSVCRIALLKRLAKLGTIIVTQPAFLYYSGDRYLKTLSADELNHLYPIQDMLHHGLRVGAGSDFPIAAPNPWKSIHSAVTSRTESNAVLPKRGIAVFDAIRLHTLGGAEANFEETIKGSLTPGKLADIIMVRENPLAIEVERLKDIQVMMTVLGGQVISNPQFPAPGLPNAFGL
jgi:predicted amidohydrolase YtcJ